MLAGKFFPHSEASLFVCMDSLAAQTYIMWQMVKRKIRISSNAEALTMQQNDPEIVWKDTQDIELVFSDPTWIFYTLVSN